VSILGMLACICHCFLAACELVSTLGVGGLVWRWGWGWEQSYAACGSAIEDRVEAQSWYQCME